MQQTDATLKYFIVQDGEKPDAIARKARKQVLTYPTIKFLSDFAVGGKKTSKRFEITTAGGPLCTAKKLILATGIKDTCCVETS